MKFLDLFAGIGGFRLGMEHAGHECIGYVEFDKYARKSYEAMHDTKGEWTAHDITKVTDDDIRQLRDRGPIHCITGGFPCQSFSIAGKRGGFDDTRGTLFFEIVRFASIIRPRYLFLENVKGLLNHNSGDTFETILRTLDELGYDVEWQLLNSKDFSTREQPTPQNRERVFIIGHSREHSRREVFPIARESGSVEENDLKPVNDSKKVRKQMKYDSINRFYDTEGISPTLDTMGGGNREPKIKVVGNVNPSGKGMNGNVYESEGVSPTLTTNKGESHKIAIKENTKQGYALAGEGDSINVSFPSSKTRRGRVGKGVDQTLETSCTQAVLTPDRINKRQNGRRFKENEEPMFTLSTQDRHGVYDGFRIRKLTPLECFRLQGFPDEYFHRAEQVNSNSQLYKQAGNSVTVNVIETIAHKLKGASN